MFLSTVSLLSIACVAMAAWIGAGLFFRVDTKIENKHKAAIEVAQFAREYGLMRLPEILTDYAVFDWSGMATKIHEFAGLVRSAPDVVAKEFDLVFKRVLERKLKQPEGRAYIAAAFNASQPPAEPEPPTKPEMKVVG